MLLRGLPPLIDAGARVLILGSFPSTASLAAQQYYAHRQNQFWPILAAITGQPLLDLDYAAKQAAVLAAGLAIWDVYGGCRRAGSLDSAIRDAVLNDFAGLVRLAPQLERVCFNGKAAARWAPRIAALGYATRVMPSTSPAYASLGFAAKLALWREGLKTRDA